MGEHGRIGEPVLYGGCRTGHGNASELLGGEFFGSALHFVQPTIVQEIVKVLHQRRKSVVFCFSCDFRGQFPQSRLNATAILHKLLFP